ncbi:F-box/LRR-repeat protein at3g58900 [Phtheirospermum japonicum]|uniref:F-box/LRR-repeat protein at3g58900 n=1 Tax=Phtheirospermum japonicum TaxID=374723 RepID=A0A830BPR9_9LAMI|nr:F-box/LRR-repeat protein at3g58900 [Phtheirospermum japonicum]
MDLISKLPDSVLISMISRIKTEEAVRTSILSKWWTNLYKFVPTISFICFNFVDRDTYCDLDLDVDHTKAFIDVCRFLELHSGPIRCFSSICCLTKSSSQALERCIHILGESGIEKLCIYFSCRAQLKPDVNFFCHLLSQMPSLKEVDLGRSSISMSSINMFSCLKLLRLDMSFRHEFNLLSLIPLLHSCPLLQEFQLAASAAPLKYNVPEVESSAIVPHSHLKKVDMSGFGGSKNEIDFALYILQSAVLLEEMFISLLVSKYTGFGGCERWICWIQIFKPSAARAWCSSLQIPTGWRMDPGPTWSQETDKEIQEQLKNQAVSRTAEVIVQFSLIVANLMCLSNENDDMEFDGFGKLPSPTDVVEELIRRAPISHGIGQLRIF